MNIKKETIIRTVILFVALINEVLTVIGVSLLPISDEQITEFLTLALTIVASLWAWWKNNSFSKKAIKADEFLASLKKESK